MKDMAVGPGSGLFHNMSRNPMEPIANAAVRSFTWEKMVNLVSIYHVTSKKSVMIKSQIM